jgi:hypothetical protein
MNNDLRQQRINGTAYAIFAYRMHSISRRSGTVLP